MDNFNNKSGGGFGLSSFLLNRGICTTKASADALSKKIMVVIIIICFLITAFNIFGGAKEEIPEKYFYDPAKATDDI